MYLNYWKYRQLAIAPSPATGSMLSDADIISLDRCICKHWKYRQLAIAPSPALAPVLLDADIIVLNRCI